LEGAETGSHMLGFRLQHRCDEHFGNEIDEDDQEKQRLMEILCMYREFDIEFFLYSYR
jgi:hypothetical protein